MTNLPEDMRERVEAALNVIDLSNVFLPEEEKKKIKQDAILALLQETDREARIDELNYIEINCYAHSCSLIEKRIAELQSSTKESKL